MPVVMTTPEVVAKRHRCTRWHRQGEHAPAHDRFEAHNCLMGISAVNAY